MDIYEGNGQTGRTGTLYVAKTRAHVGDTWVLQGKETVPESVQNFYPVFGSQRELGLQELGTCYSFAIRFVHLCLHKADDGVLALWLWLGLRSRLSVLWAVQRPLPPSLWITNSIMWLAEAPFLWAEGSHFGVMHTVLERGEPPKFWTYHKKVWLMKKNFLNI